MIVIDRCKELKMIIENLNSLYLEIFCGLKKKELKYYDFFINL
jgi:hypothetical protein